MGETLVFETMVLEAAAWGHPLCPHEAHLGLVRETQATLWGEAETSRGDRRVQKDSLEALRLQFLQFLF